MAIEYKLSYTGQEINEKLGKIDNLLSQNIATTKGNGSAYTANIAGITQITNGLKITIIPHVTSTSRFPTLNINNLGSISIQRRINTTTGSIAPGNSDSWLTAGKPVNLQYDGKYWISLDNTRTSVDDIYHKDKEALFKKYNISKFITIPANAWTSDYDANNIDRQSRVAFYSITANKWKTIIGADVTTNNNNIVKLTNEWQEFTRTFNLTETHDDFRLIVRGAGHERYTHPIDVADIVIYKTDDPTQTNILSDDIAKLNWEMSEEEPNKLSVSYEDNVKYIHTWKRSKNTVGAIANTHLSLEAGEYVIKCKLRSIDTQLYCTIPFTGIRDSSATIIMPASSSADDFMSHNVRGFAQRVGELFFAADTQPDNDIVVSVQMQYGDGGSMINLTSYNDAIIKKVLERLPIYNGEVEG